MQKGFTIIEIVIVVAIIGVIAAIAVPAYNGYAKRTNRTAVKAEMMRISQDLQRYQVANRNSFKGASSKVKVPSTFPEAGHYGLSLEVSADGKGWTLTATPASTSPVQKGDGVLALNNRGEKCWNKGSAGKCTPSKDTTWDDK